MLSKQVQIALFYIVSGVFLAINCYYLVSEETLMVNLLPFALAIILLAIMRLDKLLLLVTFFTPISLPLHELVSGLSFDMNLPTEPLLFGVLLLFIFQLAANRGFDKKILKHPISLALYFYLFWMLITTLTSTMPVVSFKFWLSKLWFLAAFYFLGIHLFKDRKNIYRFVGLYCGAFILVIFYAWSRHISYGLTDEQAAHFVMNPFYKDHTSYGAMLAFFIPFLLGLTFSSEYKIRNRILSGITLVLFSAALVFSYTRAAWLSLAVAFIVWLIIKLKIRFRPLFVTGITFVVLIILFQTQVLMFLERNNDQSSSNLATHITSMANVSTDASNLERINRWSSAIRMFEEKPVFGWGPGTYMFQYAPFQISNQRTIISTNAGDAGNAHSEYLGPLAESGLLGTLSFVLIAILILYVGIHTYTRAREKEVRLIVLSAIIGIVTYLVHGFLNNFLDTDKAAIPFWGFTAIIVLFDFYTRDKKLEEVR
ncbi:MAG TPA: O-antigen ligase family protein [Sunxiuqinia sp.]|nr:O-antigen ligase family protein [Sunxiuqinia sp.]